MIASDKIGNRDNKAHKKQKKLTTRFLTLPIEIL